MSKWDDDRDQKFYYVVVEVCIGIILFMMAWAFIFSTGCQTDSSLKDCEWFCPVNGNIPQDCYCLNDPKEYRAR